MLDEKIRKARARQNAAPVRIAVSVPREDNRDALAFLHGFTLGAMVQEDPSPIEAPRRRPVRTAVAAMLVISMLFAVFGVSLAAGWHAADAKAQNRYVEMVEGFKAAGWAPRPYGEPIGTFDRIAGK